MSGSVNKVILVGNLGRDPEIRHLTDGSKMATLSIATSEYYKDKTTGERKDKTEWHRTVIYNDKIAEIAEKYLHKGSKVFVEGQLQTRKWTDQEGKERYSTEVVLSKFRGELTLLDSKNDGTGTPSIANQGGFGGDSFTPKKVESGKAFSHGLDDDIPF